MSSNRSTFLEKYPDVAAGIDLLEHWLPVHMKNNRLPGLSMGIIVDQELIWATGVGYADLEQRVPATPQTLYRMASHTKMFTTTAIMQLRDAGKLRLDDPVSDYLPWFSIRHRRDLNGDYPPITIRHLLTHTSGLPRDATLPIWTENYFPTWEQIVETTPRRDAALLTDDKVKYSNLAFSIAGGIIEAVAGQAYTEYVRVHILEPLGMNHSSMNLAASTADLATGYMQPDAQGRQEAAVNAEVQGFMAAAGLISDVEDMARFVMLQFRDEPPEANPVLRGGTIREMHGVNWMNPDWKSGRGLGLSLRRIGERLVAGHGGGLKGYLTQTAWCRSEKFGVVALTNALNGSPVTYVDQAFAMIAPLVQAAVKPPQPEADPAWQQLVGIYRSTWGDDRYVTLEAGRLMIASLDWIDEPRMVLEPVAGQARTFRIVEGDNVGELCVFEALDSGPMRLHIAGEYSDRVAEA